MFTLRTIYNGFRIFYGRYFQSDAKLEYLELFYVFPEHIRPNLPLFLANLDHFVIPRNQAPSGPKPSNKPNSGMQKTQLKAKSLKL